jgi:hypothetical protein
MIFRFKTPSPSVQPHRVRLMSANNLKICKIRRTAGYAMMLTPPLSLHCRPCVILDLPYSSALHGLSVDAEVRENFKCVCVRSNSRLPWFGSHIKLWLILSAIVIFLSIVKKWKSLQLGAAIKNVRPCLHPTAVGSGRILKAHNSRLLKRKLHHSKIHHNSILGYS